MTMLDQATEDLLKRLAHPEQPVRWSATLVLGKLVRRRSGEEAHELVDRVRDYLQHADPDVRSNAVAALGRMAPGLLPEWLDETIRTLAPLLKDPSIAVQSETARTLGEMAAHLQGRFPAAIKTVFKALQKKLDDRETAVRGSALIGLGEMCLTLEGGPLDDAVRIFVRFLKDPEPRVRMNAAWGIGKVSPIMPDASGREALAALQAAEAAEQDTDALYHLQDARRALHHPAPGES